MTPIVLYLGPSLLDGQPIVVLASVGSSNVKTGPMLQTWIMRADLAPSEASATHADSSVCGLCPRRHALGGDCYVQIVHAPRSVWESWVRHGRPGENWTNPDQILRLQADARQHGLRLGSYGDPAAVPWHVWQDLMDAIQPRSTVGYTHQWRELAESSQTTWLRNHVMASCDTLEETIRAQLLGWRTFTAIPAAAAAAVVVPQSVQCPATRDVDPRTCTTCGICDGAGRGARKASVFLLEHGMRSQTKGKKFASLAVIA